MICIHVDGIVSMIRLMIVYYYIMKSIYRPYHVTSIVPCDVLLQLSLYEAMLLEEGGEYEHAVASLRACTKYVRSTSFLSFLRG